jgi:acyl-CoA synthetase (AMP-forming)/AMP-acid ligase II
MSGSVVDRIRSAAARFASNTAVIDGARSLSFAELFDRTDRLSAALHALGLRPLDRVLAFLPNTHQAMECELAVLQSGIVWITLTSRLTWAEVRGVLVSCAPRLLVTDEAGLARIVEGSTEIPVDRMPPVVVTGAAPGGRTGILDYDDLLASHEPRRPTVDVGDEHPARLRYTSGTMGSAKAAVLPHRVYHASLDNLRVELGPFGPEDRALHVAPLTHGSGALVYPILEAGGVNVLERHFDVDGVLSLVERVRITTMFTVPTMLSRLVASPRLDEYDLSALRALVYGGAPMPEAQLEAAVRLIGRALVHIYGMTEAPWPITALRQSEHYVGNPRLRSIGKATTICEVGIVGEDGAELGPGEIGEIRIRGRNVMTEYLDDAEATRAVLRDGWLASGDLGKIDDEGFVFIVGRKKDVIISGGFNVYASEVESVLCSHEGVLEAAVVGLPHDDWGELVAAFVVPKPGAELSPGEIEALARSRLSAYKCPRRVDIVSDLPKNASGKIQKSDIVRNALAGKTVR